jgi:hypothetical protein
VSKKEVILTLEFLWLSPQFQWFKCIDNSVQALKCMGILVRTWTASQKLQILDYDSRFWGLQLFITVCESIV